MNQIDMRSRIDHGQLSRGIAVCSKGARLGRKGVAGVREKGRQSGSKANSEGDHLDGMNGGNYMRQQR